MILVYFLGVFNKIIKIGYLVMDYQPGIIQIFYHILKNQKNFLVQHLDLMDQIIVDMMEKLMLKNYLNYLLLEMLS